MRAAAQRQLSQLAGPQAQLRDDQWQAIEALLEGRRVEVVQRTGCGKSAIYFIATGLLRERRRRPDARRLAAARADARPGGGGGPDGVRAVTINSRTSKTGRHRIGDRRRRGGPRVHQPRTVQQPGVPCAACCPELASTPRVARRRRGPLHLRLGPRLPPRLPAHPRRDLAGCGRHAGARHHRYRERAGQRDVAEQLGSGTCRAAARWTASAASRGRDAAVVAHCVAWAAARSPR